MQTTRNHPAAANVNREDCLRRRADWLTSKLFSLQDETCKRIMFQSWIKLMDAKQLDAAKADAVTAQEKEERYKRQCSHLLTKMDQQFIKMNHEQLQGSVKIMLFAWRRLAHLRRLGKQRASHLEFKRFIELKQTCCATWTRAWREQRMLNMQRKEREQRIELIAQKKRMEGPRACFQAMLMEMFSGKMERLRQGDPLYEPVEERISTNAAGLHALGKLMDTLSLKAAVISTPGRSRATAHEDPVDVMKALERLSGDLFPNFVPAYDFAGSSSQKECAAQEPDKSMSSSAWSDRESIKRTQWFRYWSGRVRATVNALITLAVPFKKRYTIDGDGSASIVEAKGTRMMFFFSIAGGPISQAEFSAIPELIQGSVADITSRQLDVGDVEPVWFHFETVQDLVKALQGYGGVDLVDACQQMKFGMPGSWIDGTYDAAYDKLQGLPGDTPQERRDYLLRRLPRVDPSAQLQNAIRANSARRVQDLLKERADPNETVHGDVSMLHIASECANVNIVELLLEHKADPSKKSAAQQQTPLEYLFECSGHFPKSASVRQNVKRICMYLSEAEDAHPCNVAI